MRKVIAYSGTSPANTTSIVDVYTIPDGYKFKLEKVVVNFGSGVNMDLGIAVFHGEKQVVPEYGTIAGTTGRLPIECEWTWQSGDRIRLYVSNSNASTDFKYSVILIGELS